MKTEENKNLHILILIICSIIYIIIMLLSGPLNIEIFRGLNGILAQVQVVCSTLIVITNFRRGFITACCLNALGAVSTIPGAIKNTASIPGVVIPCITIVTLSIIFTYMVRSRNQSAEISEQYEKIMDSNRLLREKDESLRAVVYTDRLTNMYNNLYFYEKVDELAGQKKPFTLIYADIDNFKSINDTFGPRTGDTALRIYAERVRTFCEGKYLCARISGDEFGILISEEISENEILGIIEQLRMLFSQTITAQMTNLTVTASFGIVLYPRDGNTAEVLVDNAIIATYTAKANGKDRAYFFS